MTTRSDASVRAASELSGGATHHRRNSRAAATVAATVGAALVATTAAAPAAEAKDPYAVWNRVATCESSRNWHINTGNGFYGGLQFSASTWRGFHGTKYASRADRATRLEQIEVARRVLASQGPGAWPVCGPRAGLTRRSGHATHAPLPRVAGAPSHARHAAKATAKRTKHVGRHRAAHTYRVRSGDTLSRIARREHVAGGWHALYRANRSHLSDPDVLRVGQVLRIP
jgi:nucleoid-associated protein YgaU